MTQTTLWTIRQTATLSLEMWDRFVAKTRAAGSNPARVLEDFIRRYLETP